MSTSLPQLMNTNELAAYLRLSPETIKTWRVTGKGPAFTRAAKDALYDVVDVAAYVASKKVDPTKKGSSGA